MNPISRPTPLAAALFAAGALSLGAGATRAQTPAVVSEAAPSAGAANSAAAGAATTAAADAAQRVTVQGESGKDWTPDTTSLTKLPADLHDVPQSITVISKSLLQSQGATSLSDALRNVPGITLGGAEGGQIGNNINLNGFTARTDIYLDGFRDRGQYYRDTFALDSVEVLMGPSSMLFGRGSTGGVINQVSKVPQTRTFTDMSVSGTTNGLVRATVDHNQRIDDSAAFRISVMGQDGHPTTRDVMKNRDYGVAPALRFGIGEPTEITLSALLQHNHDQPDYGVSPLNGRPAPVGRDDFFGYADDRTDQDVATFTAQVRHRLGESTVLRNQIQSNHVHVDARETASQGVGFVDPANPDKGFQSPAVAGVSDLPVDQLLVRLQSHDRIINDHSVFDQADLSTQFDTGFLHHDLLVGGEIGKDEYSNQSLSRTGDCGGVTLASGFVGCEPLTAPDHADSPTRAEVAGNLSTSSADSTAIFVGDTVALGSQVKLVGGIRRDWFSARIHNTVTKPNDVAQSVANTSYRAGAIWQPSAAQSYYASFSTSFNPSLEQLTNTTGTTTPLPPEHNKAWEGGGKIDLLDGKLSLNAAVFQITQYDSRSQNPDGTYSATGTIRVRGGRVGGSGLLARGWKVFAGYSYLDARILDGIAVGTEGMRPANTPRHSASLWSTYEFMPHWEVGGGGSYLSSRFMNNTDVAGVPAYLRMDATLAYKQHDYDVRLNVFNLFDRKYYDALIQSDGGRAVPGSGRTAMLTLSYHL